MITRGARDQLDSRKVASGQITELFITVQRFSMGKLIIEFNGDTITDKISCGYAHSLLLLRERDIYVFESNDKRELGINTECKKQLLPIKLNTSHKFTDSFTLESSVLFCTFNECFVLYLWKL